MVIVVSCFPQHGPEFDLRQFATDTEQFPSSLAGTDVGNLCAAIAKKII
jgi:hypothetical protein